MSQKTGWLEKWNNGLVASILEVQFHRVKIKKTSKKKTSKANVASFRDSALYYVLDKKVNLGKLTLTGNSVFSQKEIVEVALPVPKSTERIRLLGKIIQVTTFMELKRVVFRGHVQFVAANKEDFDRLVAQQSQRAALPPQPSLGPKRSPVQSGGLKTTFKRT